MTIGVLGCGPVRSPVTPQVVRPSPAVPTPKAPPPAPRITSDAAGPLRLGMAAEEVRALPNLTVTPWDRKLEGQPAPALTIQQFGMPIGYAELEDGKVWRIAILSQAYRTPEGAHAGMRAKELEGVYGPGRVLIGEGNVCAVFDKAPGLSFCFQSTPELLKLDPDAWPKLAAANPRVQRVLITGGD